MNTSYGQVFQDGNNPGWWLQTEGGEIFCLGEARKFNGDFSKVKAVRVQGFLNLWVSWAFEKPFIFLYTEGDPE